MPTLTSENATQAVVKLVANEVLGSLMSRTMVAGLVNRNYENTMQKAGDTVTIPIAPALEANNIAETGSVQTQNPSMGDAQVVLDKHYESTFQITDIAQVLTQPDLVDTYAKEAIKAIARQLETDLLGLYPMFTFNAVQGTANTALTEGVIDAAETALFKAEVDTDEPLNLIVSPDAYSDLRQISRFTENATSGNGSAIENGFVGTIKKFRVYRSNRVHIVSTTTNNLAFGRDAIALVTRPMPLPQPGSGAIGAYAEFEGWGCRTIMSYNPNTLAHQFTVDILCGMTDLRKEFGVQVRS